MKIIDTENNVSSISKIVFIIWKMYQNVLKCIHNFQRNDIKSVAER